MRLSVLLQELDSVVCHQRADCEIQRLACHSQHVREETLFVAIRGHQDDGHRFVREAVRRGAAAVVIDTTTPLPHDRLRVPLVQVADTRAALIRLAGRFFSFPAHRLMMTGITGTNGKTTVSYLMEYLLTALQESVGVVGTVDYRWKHRRIPASNTTPGPLELHSYFAEMVRDGVTHCVMEVSSHALSQRRVDGIPFRVAILTNITSDHLDYHQTRESYVTAKRSLFARLDGTATAVLNIDDEEGHRLALDLQARRVGGPRLLTYALSRPADLTALIEETTLAGTRCRIVMPHRTLSVWLPMVGRHNVANLLAALGGLIALGYDPAAVTGAIESFPGVPGRTQLFRDAKRDFTVCVDYAHTEDALTQILQAVRPACAGRLLVVFGCGGDRDRSKRPRMGAVASRLADVVILTDDNPRHEASGHILREIASGLEAGLHASEVIPDRHQAIERAVQLARAGDLIVIAGKGHEAYQIYGDTIIPCDDRMIVQRLLTVDGSTDGHAPRADHTRRTHTWEGHTADV